MVYSNNVMAMLMCTVIEGKVEAVVSIMCYSGVKHSAQGIVSSVDKYVERHITTLEFSDEVTQST